RGLTSPSSRREETAGPAGGGRERGDDGGGRARGISLDPTPSSSRFDRTLTNPSPRSWQPAAGPDGTLRAARGPRRCPRRGGRSRAPPAWAAPARGGEVLLQRVRRRELVRDGLLHHARAVPVASAGRRLRCVPTPRQGSEAQLVPSSPAGGPRPAGRSRRREAPARWHAGRTPASSARAPWRGVLGNIRVAPACRLQVGRRDLDSEEGQGTGAGTLASSELPLGPPGRGPRRRRSGVASSSGQHAPRERARGQCADSDASCYWRCGSGAYLTEEARGCTTGAFPLGQGWFDAVGDDCQTIGAVGARSTAAGGIFFGVEKGGPLQSDLFDAEGRLFWPVLALFASDYCTGPWQEYYGQSDSWEPRSLSGETPGAQSFKSYRIYMKPADEEEVEGTLGIKTVFFPYFDMAPYDQTICKSCQEEGGLCGGKSLYTPWSETQEWPGLDCVSPDDRVSCFTPGDQMWYATVNGNGGSGYGCVDFAGCTICESGSDQKFCEDNCPQFGFSPNDWCRGSPITSLYSYPLGSFYPITTCTSPQKPWGTAVRRAIAATACPRTTVRVTRFARLAQVCTTSTGIIVWRPASTTARTT
ncbi:unnamed protein product, partial [Prorocentrum cordatum]